MGVDSTAQPNDQLAIVMGGGAARGAYQVGVLRAIAERYPDLRISILTGVSAGAINAVFLASQRGPFSDRVQGLSEMWSGLEVGDIFRTDLPSLAGKGFRWIFQLGLLGGRRGVPNVRGLVDTSPLEGLLRRAFHSVDGNLGGINTNLGGDLRAVAVTATDYGTGETITFCEGRAISTWDRPKRRSVRADLTIRHVLASAALPLFFPAVRVDGRWYGDGGVRLHSPLAPACHLGADRILAISTRHEGPAKAAESNVPPGYPPPAQILGVMYNAVFQDNLEQDAAHMERVNALVEAARGGPTTHRRLALAVIRPSVDLGAIAHDFEPELPGAFRFAMRRLGTRQQKSPDLISMLMFQRNYLCRLMEIGEADGRQQMDRLSALIEGREAGAAA